MLEGLVGILEGIRKPLIKSKRDGSALRLLSRPRPCFWDPHRARQFQFEDKVA